MIHLNHSYLVNIHSLWLVVMLTTQSVPSQMQGPPADSLGIIFIFSFPGGNWPLLSLSNAVWMEFPPAAHKTICSRRNANI